MPHAQLKLPSRADPGKSGQNITRKDVTSTYVVWVSGELMEDSGISDGPEPMLNRAPELRTGLWSLWPLNGS
jgi:hypothetical protein